MIGFRHVIYSVARVCLPGRPSRSHASVAGAHGPMVEHPGITVIMGLFGPGYAGRVRAAVRSIQRQTLGLEVILSELCDRPLYGELATELGVRHVTSPPVRYGSSAAFSASMAGNAGLALVRSDWVYHSDADVFFPSRTFFERLAAEVCTDKSNVATYAPLKHLPASRVGEFVEGVDWSSLSEDLPSTAFLDFREGKFFPGEEGEVRRIGDGKPWVMTESRHQAARSMGYRGRGYEMFAVWQPALHFGGMLASTEFLIDLGGYCEEFVAYGFEDVDIIWKASHNGNLIELYKAQPDLVTIHLDHPRPYFLRIAFERNMMLHRLRKLRGLDDAIASDRACLEKTMERIAPQKLT